MSNLNIGQIIEINKDIKLTHPFNCNVIHVKKGDKAVITAWDLVMYITGDGKGKEQPLSNMYDDYFLLDAKLKIIEITDDFKIKKDFRITEFFENNVMSVRKGDKGVVFENQKVLFVTGRAKGKEQPIEKLCDNYKEYLG